MTGVQTCALPISDKNLLIRRVSLTAGHAVSETDAADTFTDYQQMNLFTSYTDLEEQEQAEKSALEREKKIQKAVLDIKKKFGKNAVLKGMNLEAGATSAIRNRQIGGHKA